MPTIPGMKALLPRAAALEALSGLLPDRKLAAQVLDYWLKIALRREGHYWQGCGLSSPGR